MLFSELLLFLATSASLVACLPSSEESFISLRRTLFKEATEATAERFGRNALLSSSGRHSKDNQTDSGSNEDGEDCEDDDGGSSGDGECPDIWTTIAADLQQQFTNPATGECNDISRAAIRMAFHDCAAWKTSFGETGGCDGSILLAEGELNRTSNLSFKEIAELEKQLLNEKYDTNVTTADFVQFAGAVATVNCRGGPAIQMFVGRKDSSELPPPDLLPNASGAGSDAKTISRLFNDKGFTDGELAALLGAHTTAKQRFEFPKFANDSMDSTPEIWDVRYYEETLAAKAVGTDQNGVLTFPSDKNLATDNTTGVAEVFRSFVGQQDAWVEAFIIAATKLSLLGVPKQGLIDCSSALPAFRPIDKTRRAVASASYHGSSGSYHGNYQH